MPAKPAKVVESNNAAVGRRSDAEVEAPVDDHQIRDAIVALRRQRALDDAVGAVISELRDYAPVIAVAMADVNLVMIDDHPPDRSVDLKPRLKWAKGNTLSRRVDGRRRQVRLDGEDPRFLPVDPCLGDQHRAVAVERDSARRIEVVDRQL